MRDIVLSAFSVFFTQSPSFLSYQRSMQRNRGPNNGRTLFGIDKIPTDAQIRNVLDGVNYRCLDPVFMGAMGLLQQNKDLDSYRVLDKQLLVCMDGTEFFTSTALSCPLCSTHHPQRRNGQPLSQRAAPRDHQPPGRPRKAGLRERGGKKVDQ